LLWWLVASSSSSLAAAGLIPFTSSWKTICLDDLRIPCLTPSTLEEMKGQRRIATAFDCSILQLYRQPSTDHHGWSTHQSAYRSRFNR
jgi:hypothetical protein